MLVEKCKRVVMEERRGRHRARRMAREVGRVAMNPVGAVGGLAGNAFSSIAGEEMSGGAKVLLLLAGAGIVGGGIYYFMTKPATAPVAPTMPTMPSVSPLVNASNTYAAQQAAAAAAASAAANAASRAAGPPH